MKRKASGGFTLIELMVTVAIVAILAAVAAPSFSQFIAGQRVKSASYDISYTLTFVRSEAIKRNVNVVLAPTGGAWENGWSVTAGATTLGQHEPFANLTIGGPVTNLTYNGNGRLTAAATPFQISASAVANVTPRCVSIDLSGLPSSKSGIC